MSNQIDIHKKIIKEFQIENQLEFKIEIPKEIIKRIFIL